MNVKNQKSYVNITVLTLMEVTTAPATQGMFLKKTTPAVLVSYRAIYNFVSSCVCIHISDIDECQIETGGCTQICNNTVGSYHCECWDGYEMGNDSICIGESYFEYS